MNYLHWLRAHIGPRKTLLAYATALVRDAQGRLLFQRRADFPGQWGLPGGLLELDETLAECAVREVREETGLTVEPIRLVGVYSGPQYEVRYPNGDEVQQWTAACECRVTGGQLQTDGVETTAAEFFEPAALPPTLLWYAAMLADLAARQPYATFEPPRLAHTYSPQPFIREIRAQVGHARLLVPSAAACIYNPAGHILLARRSDTGRWGPPGGLMDLGESIAETICREVLEEVNLTVVPERLIGVYSGHSHTYPNGDQIQVCTSFFACRWTEGEPRLNDPENTAVAFFPLEALPENTIPRWRPRLAHAAAHLAYTYFE